MEKQKVSEKNIQKLVKESLKAASIAVRNSYIVETLLSIQEIKKGNYKTFSSAEDMFKKFGI